MAHQGEGVASQEADEFQGAIDEHGDQRPDLRAHRLLLQRWGIDYHRHCYACLSRTTVARETLKLLRRAALT